MCEKDSCEKRSEIVGDKERASKGGKDKDLEMGVVNAHEILGWKCLLETHHGAQ